MSIELSGNSRRPKLFAVDHAGSGDHARRHGIGQDDARAGIVESDGAIRIRSDVERKRLMGFDAGARTGFPSPEGCIRARRAGTRTSGLPPWPARSSRPAIRSSWTRRSSNGGNAICYAVRRRAFTCRLPSSTARPPSTSAGKGQATARTRPRRVRGDDRRARAPAGDSRTASGRRALTDSGAGRLTAGAVSGCRQAAPVDPVAEGRTLHLQQARGFQLAPGDGESPADQAGLELAQPVVKEIGAVDRVSWLIMMPAEKATGVPSRRRHKQQAIGGYGRSHVPTLRVFPRFP